MIVNVLNVLVTVALLYWAYTLWQANRKAWAIGVVILALVFIGGIYIKIG